MLSDLNYYSKLITVTLVPLFVLALLALLVAAVRVLSRVKDPTKLKRLKAKIVEGCSFASLSFLFVMYPFVSLKWFLEAAALGSRLICESSVR